MGRMMASMEKLDGAMKAARAAAAADPVLIEHQAQQGEGGS